MSATRWVLGVRVDDATYDESLAAIERFIQERGPHLVTTPNPEFVMAAQADAEYRALLNSAALAVPDGVGLIWAGRLSGLPFREHVRGTDLVLRLARRSAEAGHRWFLLGAAPGIAEQAAEALRREAPGLAIVGTFAGQAGPAGDAVTRAAIRAVGAVDVVLVAYGAPRQEQWLARNQGELGIPVGIGVGGVFNYLAGVVPRAPAWLRRLELEWLHRLLTQPWRWRRQLSLPQFVFAVLVRTYVRRQPAVSRTDMSPPDRESEPRP